MIPKEELETFLGRVNAVAAFGVQISDGISFEKAGQDISDLNVARTYPEIAPPVERTWPEAFRFIAYPE